MSVSLSRAGEFMERREFIWLLGGAAATWPFVAHAQQSLVGFLNPGSQADFGHHAEVLLRGLKEGGFTEGETLTVEYRWAEGRYDRLPQLAEELVKLEYQLLPLAHRLRPSRPSPRHRRSPSSS